MTEMVKLEMLRDRLQPAMDKLALQRQGLEDIPEISQETIRLMRIFRESERLVNRVLYKSQEVVA